MLAVRIVAGIRSHLSTRWIEWVFTGMFLALSLQLWRSGHTFASSQGYRVMAWIADEDTWGGLLFCVALIRGFALTANGTFDSFKRFSPYARAACAALSACVWASIGISIGIANSIGTGEITYTGLTVCDVIMFVRISREAGRAEKDYRCGCARTS